jgi:hypothetical protein
VAEKSKCGSNPRKTSDAASTSGKGVPGGKDLRVYLGGETPALCCLTAQGSIECWGSNVYGESSSNLGPFTQPATTQNTTCGLHSNGRLERWGIIPRPEQ